MMRTTTTLMAILAAMCCCSAMAAEPVAPANVPDLTKSLLYQEGKDKGNRVTDVTHDMNLGPTGLRGWIWAEANTTATRDARQILVTAVDSGSPAAGKVNVEDVILGVNGKPFDSDARRALAAAVTAAETEAGGGKLHLLVYRQKGQTEPVTLQLKVLGTYSQTAPINCPKTAKIIDEACKSIVSRIGTGAKGEMSSLGEGIDSMINGLGLLATGRAEYLPLVKAQAAKVAAIPPVPDSLCTWSFGYRNLFLCEYSLATGDKSVLPAIKGYSLAIAKGQSNVGTWGHGFQVGGIDTGYGSMNAAGIPCVISMILAEKCGIKEPVIHAATLRGVKYLQPFTGRGGIPYGDRAATITDSNGKSSMAAVLFDLAGEQASATWHAKLSMASYEYRENGHTGHYFNMMWGPLGSGLLGNAALSAHLRELLPILDLERRWDGSFAYQPNPGAGGMSNHKYGKWDCTGARLLALCYPLHKLSITGRQPSRVPQLDGPAVAAVIASGRPDFAQRSQGELMKGLRSWFPAERLGCAQALADQGEKQLGTLMAGLSKDDLATRTILCSAIASIARAKVDASSAIDLLIRQLDLPDVALKLEAVDALYAIGAPARAKGGPALLALAQQTIADDPQHLVKRKILEALFNRSKSGNGLYSANYEGVDRKLVIAGLKALIEGTDNAFDMRFLGVAYKNMKGWPIEDVAPLFPGIVDLIENPRSSGQMDSFNLPVQGFEFLAQYGVTDALDAFMVSLNNPATKFKPPCMILPQVEKYYGVEAKRYLPQLREYLPQIPTRYPRQIEGVTTSTRQAIAEIEKTTATKKLIRIKDLKH